MSPAPPTTVHLVRHGETDWNLTQRWQGHTDIPLNPRGLSQAEAVARRLQREAVRPVLIASSDLSRALRTAEAIGALLGAPVETHLGLREIDVGRWQGRTRAETEALEPGVLARIDAGEDLPRGGAERFADLVARCAAVFDSLLERAPGSSLIVVTHGGSVRALLRHALGAGRFDYPVLPIGNTSLTTLEGSPGAWRLERLDDRAHLGEGAPRADVEGA